MELQGLLLYPIAQGTIFLLILDGAENMPELTGCFVYALGSAALETNLKASEGYLTRSLNDQGINSKRLHRYRAIVGGTPLFSTTFRPTNDSGDSQTGSTGGKSGKGCDYMCVLKDDRVAVSCIDESVIFVYDKNLESKQTIKVEQCTSLKVFSLAFIILFVTCVCMTEKSWKCFLTFISWK